MGAVAVANVTPVDSVHGLRAVAADLTMSSSYATGGDTLSPALLGLSEVYEMFVLGGVLTRGGESNAMSPIPFAPAEYGFQPTLAGSTSAPKVLVYSSKNTQETSATDLSTNGSVRVEFRGV